MKVKARTKAAKRRAGRPRKEGVLRTEGGRISRSSESKALEERLMLEAATWKRRQVNPTLSVEDARKPEHGSVIHAWKVAHDKFVKKHGAEEPNPMMFTASDLEMARRIHEAYLDYRVAIASRNPRSSSDFGAPGGFDGSDPFEGKKANRDSQAINRWVGEDRKSGIRGAILRSGPFGLMAVEAIVFENRPAASLIGDLRLALNEVDRVSRLKRAA